MNAFRAKYRPLLFSKGEYIPTGTLQDSDIVGAIADAIAKNVAKLKPQVIRYDEKGMVIKNDSLSRLLSLRPCPEMSTYDSVSYTHLDVYKRQHLPRRAIPKNTRT